MTIYQSGFEYLAITEGRTKVVITPDRENHGVWFVDHTASHSRARLKRTTMTTKELRAAVGIIDRRVKIKSYLPGKFIRNKNSVIISPERNGSEIPVNSEVRQAVKKLLTNTRKTLN